MIKTGIGYDIHKLALGKKLRVGGVEIKSEFGSVGHSDGDVIIHSTIDAILGALRKKDIGLNRRRQNNLTDIYLL